MAAIVPTIRVAATPFDVGAEIAAAQGNDPAVGAVASFVGYVRADGGMAGETHHAAFFVKRGGLRLGDVVQKGCEEHHVCPDVPFFIDLLDRRA